MSRIGFCAIGFLSSGVASLDPLNGWFLNAGVSEALPNPELPRGVSMAEAVMLCWRANAIALNYDLTYTPTDGGDPISYSGSNFLSLTTGQTTETDLIFGNIGGPAWEGADDNSIAQFSMVNIGFDGTLIFPLFTLTIGTGPTLSLAGDPTDVTSIELTSSSIPSLEGLPTYAGDADGWSGTVSLEVNGYWSYDGIWDTTTGAQLISPIPEGL